MISKSTKKTKYVAGLPAYNVIILLFLVAGLSTIGYFILKSQAADGVKPPLQGLIDRKGYPAKPEARSSLGGFVINVNWNEIQPSSGNDLVTTKIDNAINQAKSSGLKIKLRLLAGSQSPNWAMSLGGAPITYYEPVDKNSVSYQVPRFWTSEYGQAYTNLQNKLASRYDKEDTLREITISRCMTVYSEPFIRGITDTRNATNLLKAGYTVAKDQNCQREQVVSHKAWAKTHSSFAYSPYQVVKTKSNGQPTVDTDVDFTIQMMDYCRANLGNLCTLSNNSIDAKVKAGYQELYDAIKARGPAITYQTESTTRLSDLASTLDWALAGGANAVELNANYSQDMSSSQLKSYNNKFFANPVSSTSTSPPVIIPTNTLTTTPSPSLSPTTTPSPSPSLTPSPTPTVSAKPGTPQNLKVAAGSSNVLAAWTPPTGSTLPSSYLLKVDGREYYSYSLLYNIVGLKPKTHYELSVQSRDQAGVLSDPATIKFTTDCMRLLWWCW